MRRIPKVWTILVSIICFSCSRLQTCGLISSSRKMKKERGGSPWRILPEPRKIHTRVQILQMLVHICRTIKQQMCPQTQAPSNIVVIFGRLKILIPSSQQYLSLQRTILTARDPSQDIENNLNGVINQRYRISFVDVVAM